MFSTIRLLSVVSKHRPNISRFVVSSSSCSYSSSTAGRGPISSSSTNNNNNRPFRILGLQQVAIGNEERGPLDKLWKDIFGLEPVVTKQLEKENVIEDIIQLGPSPYQVEIDLMVPIDKDKSPKV